MSGFVRISTLRLFLQRIPFFITSTSTRRRRRRDRRAIVIAASELVNKPTFARTGEKSQRGRGAEDGVEVDAGPDEEGGREGEEDEGGGGEAEGPSASGGSRGCRTRV